MFLRNLLLQMYYDVKKGNGVDWVACCTSLLRLHNKIAQTEGLEEQKFVPHSSRGWKAKVNVPHIWFLVRAPFLS
jgi:hypothetical protein